MSDKVLSTINITAFAGRELPNDVLSIYFTASASGQEPNAVQEELRKKLSDALAVIRPVLKEGEVETETQGFSVSPRYNNKSVITGYYGQCALTVKGTDTATISEFAAKIKTMVVNGTGNSLSKKLRKSVEAEIVAEAITNFKAKADAAVAAFGLKSWKIGNVNVQVDRDYGRGGGRVMAMSAAASMESTNLEVESGKTDVNGSVSGTIIVGMQAGEVAPDGE